MKRNKNVNDNFDINAFSEHSKYVSNEAHTGEENEQNFKHGNTWCTFYNRIDTK